MNQPWKNMAKKAAIIILLLFSINALAFNQINAIKKLSPIVENCAFRHDTNHYVFHGCIDWHSSVHGYWAILYSAHVLHDKALANKVLQQLTANKIKQELNFIKQQDQLKTNFEMPYGRAWFLQLARDAETFYHIKTLRPLANYLYKTLINYAKHNGGSITATDYRNSSWYLYQTYEWAKFINDKKTQQEIKQLALSRFNKKITWPQYNKIRGFFAPKALAALLLTNIAPNSHPLQNIIKEYQQEKLTPIQPPFKTPHNGGLNFSRSWGLISLYQLTKNKKFLQAYNSHMNTMLKTLPQWSQDYNRYAHWVAQFGIFSLRLK
jgi:hypothetical protein